jgi:hypothetical protein
MKLVLHDLKVGETVQGIVAEKYFDGELLISFSGDLLRVSNETNQVWKVGERVACVVKSIDPLQFTVPKNREHRSGHLDVSV